MARRRKNREEKFLANRLFDDDPKAEGELRELLIEAGAKFEGLGADHYDCSVELYDVPADHRLPEAAQAVIHKAGFLKAYVNHTDKWETHYGFNPRESFEAIAGWRVSYPHDRNDGDKSIWVEEHIKDWPQDWFKTGYVVIKPKSIP